MLNDKLWHIEQADCLEFLQRIPDNYVSSLVTDPPAAIFFMNKEWDADKGGKEEWCEWLSLVLAECYRVLKPGAHGLIWTLPKRTHWVLNSIEDSEFEIKDIIHHLQGNGFPTGCDLGKEIDKKKGATRKVLGKDPKLDNRYNVMLTEPATDEAKKWDGWKTKLKPSVEHWILCQKPIVSKTITDSVLKYGTGGLNIKACENEHGKYPTNAVLSDVDFGKQGEYFPQFNEPWIYCARPQANERNQGLDEMPKHQTGFGDVSIDETKNNTNKGPCNQLRKDTPTISANYHPTVKPVKLMRWLCKLITEPKGIVLDPFVGSGTTGMAALEEGFRFLGCEINANYMEIAKKRIESVLPR